MTKYECPCGYVYDPELGDPDNGVAPGTPWEDVPEDWVCPVCGLGKDAFNEESEAAGVISCYGSGAAKAAPLFVAIRKSLHYNKRSKRIHFTHGGLFHESYCM